MMKIAFAAIPVAIVVGVIYAIGAAVLAGILSSGGR